MRVETGAMATDPRSPLSSPSEDWENCSLLTEGDTDSTEDREATGEHIPPTNWEAPKAQQEESWPDLPEPQWPVEENALDALDCADWKLPQHIPEAQEFPPAPPVMFSDTEQEGLLSPEEDDQQGNDAVEGESDAKEIPFPEETVARQEPCDGQEWPPTPLELGMETGEGLLMETVDGLNLRKATNPQGPSEETTSHSGSSDDGLDRGEPLGAASKLCCEMPEDPTTKGDTKSVVDHQSLDFSTAREQWMKLENSGSSRPPQPSFSRSSSRNQLMETASSSPANSSHKVQPEGAVLPLSHQEELLHCLKTLQQAQEQQVQKSLPLATVAQESANEGARSGSFVVVRELKGTERGEGPPVGRLTGAAKQGTAWTGKAGRESTEEGSIPAHGEEKAVTRRVRMELENGDDNLSDSGVSADFSPGSTLEMNSSFSGALPANETPIEREIRLALEREENLRRSRGISKPSVSEEYVEIPLRKPILSQSLPSKAGKGKDRHFAGKKMQMEISMETQREEDLVQLGKVPGVYDKGTVRQLRERKMLFEVFQESKDPATTPRATADDASLGGSPRSSILERRRSLDLVSQSPGPSPAQGPLSGTGSSVNLEPKGPSLTEGAVGKVIILENTIRIPATLLRAAPVTNDPARSHEGERAPVLDSRGVPSAPQGEEEPDGEVLLEDEPPRENPFFKLRSSMSLKPEVEQDIREAQQRERELRRQRYSLYGTAGGPRDSEEPRPATPNGLAIPSTPPPNRPVSPSPSPSPSPAPSARQSLGKLDVTWPPPCQPAAELSGQTEVKGSPKTPRQKIPLLQRWETGLVNGHQEED